MLWALLIGLLVGALAKLIMPGRDPGGIIVTMLLGVAGSVLAHWIGTSTGRYMGNEPAGIFSSIFGAVILLAIYRLIIGRRNITH